MPKYLYKAKKNPREIIEDTIQAENRTSAIQKLSGLGYFIIEIDEYTRSIGTIKGTKNIFQSRISLRDVTNFTRQLSDLLESGLTIARALDILYNQTINRRLRDIIVDIRDSCMDGNPLSSALSRHPRIFSHLYVSMVRSGETGGALENILRRLADFNDRQLEIQTKICSALAYPILMSMVGGITIIVLLTFVIPKMVAMFGDFGQSLPLPTLILIKISDAIKNFWWLIVAICFVIGFIIKRLYNTREGRIAIDAFKMQLPVFGDLIKKMEVARFTRTLATLLHNGVPILESLDVVVDTVSNAVIQEEAKKISTAVKDGANLAYGFSRTNTIQPFVINMISVGEESGQVERSLFKVAESYDRESDDAVKVMMSLLEPLLILVLGLAVGFIVISMLLPIFEINFLAR